MTKNRTDRGWAWRLWMILISVFLYGPVVLVVALSFNVSKFGSLPFQFTLHWYQALVHNTDIIGGAVRSFLLSLAVATIACLIGVPAAMWLARFARRAGVLMMGLLASAVTIPWLILSVSILLVSNGVGLGRSFVSLYAGSVVVVLPYVVFLVTARLRTEGEQLRNASSSLGASAFYTFTHVTIPGISAPLFAGWFFSFLITFNNFPIQYFLAPFGYNTLPIQIYTRVRSGYEPDVNALATLLLGLVLVVIFLSTRKKSGASVASFLSMGSGGR
jgi:spermidine/putrescine transport system permease protein